MAQRRYLVVGPRGLVGQAVVRALAADTAQMFRNRLSLRQQQRILPR